MGTLNKGFLSLGVREVLLERVVFKLGGKGGAEMSQTPRVGKHHRQKDWLGTSEDLNEAPCGWSKKNRRRLSCSWQLEQG